MVKSIWTCLQLNASSMMQWTKIRRLNSTKNCLFPIVWYSCGGNHPEDDLRKFGLLTKYEKNQNPFILFATCLNNYKNTWWFFLMLWILAILFRKWLKLQLKNSKILQQCKISDTKKRLLRSFLYYHSRQVMLY